MRNLTIRGIALGAALALAGTTAGVAQASQPNVVKAIRAQDKIIGKSPVWKALQNPPTTAAGFEQLIAEVPALVKAGDHAIAVVSKSTTTSAKQRAGKQDWLKGSRQQLQGLNEAQTALTDLFAGNATTAQTELAKAVQDVAAGTKLSTKGDKLLGLPQSY